MSWFLLLSLACGMMPFPAEDSPPAMAGSTPRMIGCPGRTGSPEQAGSGAGLTVRGGRVLVVIWPPCAEDANRELTDWADGEPDRQQRVQENNRRSLVDRTLRVAWLGVVLVLLSLVPLI